MTQKTFKDLELLRFLCAFVIVAWHYQHFFLITDVNGPHIAGWAPELQPLHRLLFVPYTYGGYAVNAFWIISGFIFFWKYAEVINSRTISWPRFFILRFSRLYPLHILTLFFVAALQYLHHKLNGFYAVYPAIDAYHFVLNLFMASGWGLDRDFSFNAPIWSVSAEEVIYAFFFLAAMTVRMTFIRATLLAIAFYLIMKAAQRSGIPSAMPIPMCGAYFFFGGAAQRVYKALRLSPARFWRCLGTVPETLGNLTYSSYLLHFPIVLDAVG